MNSLSYILHSMYTISYNADPDSGHLWYTLIVHSLYLKDRF